MTSFRVWVQLVVIGGLPILHAQTSIDLRTQTKSVDFSSANFTKPSKVGTTLPSTCSVGETFFNAAAPSGHNLYGCTAPNTWTLLGGNLWFGGGSFLAGDCARFDSGGNLVSAGAACGSSSTTVNMTSPFTAAGSLLVSAGTGRQGIAGQCSEANGTLSCPGGFSGRTTWLGGTGSNSRQILGPAGSFSSNFNYRWSDTVPSVATLMKIGTPAGGESSLGPAVPDTDYVTPSGSGTLQNKTFDGSNLFGSYLPWTQISKPSAPSAGYLRIYARTAGGLCWVNSAGVETCPTAGIGDPGGTGLMAETAPGTMANRTITGGSANISITNGNGTGGNPTIDIGSTVDFTGKTTSPVQVGTTAAMPSSCSMGQLYFASDGVPGRKLQTCTSVNTWAPAGYDQGSVTPATCSVGQVFFNTNASAGLNLYFCTTANTWTQMHSDVASVFGRTGAVTAQAGDYSYSQISGTPAAMPPNGGASGDLSGNYPNPTVSQVNGAGIPASGILKANASRQLVQAVAGTDYAPPTNGNAILKGSGSGGFSNATSGLDYAPPTGGTGLLKGNGSGGFSVANDGVDYETPLAFPGPLNRAGNTITCGTASSGSAGCLSATDWNTFNNKQNTLTNPVTGTGVPGNLAKFTAGGTIGAAIVSDVIGMFSGCTGAQYLGADGACHTAPGGSGGGYLVLTTGADTPSANCTAPSTTNLAVYLDTTNGDEWWCYATNSWKKMLSVTGSGPYGITGGTGNAPSTPSNGFVSCYFDEALTQVCIDSSNTAWQMVKGTTLAGLQKRSCDIVVGDASGNAVTNAQLGPQKHACKIPQAGTVLEIDIESDAGSPNVIVGRRRCTAWTSGTCSAEGAANLTSSALAASSGYTGCSNAGGTAGIDGGTTCIGTLQNTALNGGDWIELVSGTAGGAAKLVSIHVVYSVN